MFSNRDYSSSGFNVLELYFLGQKQYITVDDQLPVLPAYMYYDASSLVNSGMSDNNAWWLPVLEKGMAKFFQQYLSMDGGWETIALRALTGMPVDRFQCDEMTNQEVFDTIAENDDSNSVMTAACLVSVDGLYSGHAYSVIGVNY